jgi:hypothetical protein
VLASRVSSRCYLIFLKLLLLFRPIGRSFAPPGWGTGRSPIKGSSSKPGECRAEAEPEGGGEPTRVSISLHPQVSFF